MKKLILAIALMSSMASYSAFACGGSGLDVFGDKSHELTAKALYIVTGAGENRHTTNLPLGKGASIGITSHNPDELNHQIRMISQNADGLGVINSTYEISDIDYQSNTVVSKKTYRIGSNYHGNGVWSKGGCVTIEELK